MISKIHIKDRRAVRHFKFSNSTYGWKNELFYENRFFDEGLHIVEYVKWDDDFEK